MAYLPVDFDLHDFQLHLNAVQSAKFHKRLKELGFDSHQQGDTLTYGRGKSRITAFVHNGAELNFLPDFFDDTPGGTVYAILEKMCVAFGGTMMGQYSVPSLGKTWDVRISQGMNLSGRPDVGQRDTVVEEDGSTPSSGASAPQPAAAQQKAAQAVAAAAQPAAPVRDTDIQDGQQRESSRDKLYRVFVEEQYQKHVEANGDDPAYFLQLAKAFNEQFPKEEKEEAPSINQATLDAILNSFNLPSILLEEASDEALYNVAHSLWHIPDKEDYVEEVAEEYGLEKYDIARGVELILATLDGDDEEEVGDDEEEM